MAENEAAKQTYVVMRPPPGTRFSIWGSDVRLDFQKGREREIVAWLRTWIDSYIEPLALRAEAIAAHEYAIQNPQINTVNANGVNKIKSILDDILNNPAIDANAVDTENGDT